MQIPAKSSDRTQEVIFFCFYADYPTIPHGTEPKLSGRVVSYGGIVPLVVRIHFLLSSFDCIIVDLDDIS